MPFDAEKAAQYIAAQHNDRKKYQNLPPEIAPQTLADAYAAQEALITLWQPTFGKIAGLKIATTTRIMQELMGIDHPCGGIIYERRVHASPASITNSNFTHLVIECELAVRLDADLPKRAAPYTPEEVRTAIGAIMPAFELIEDRNAVYKETSAFSLIADNAWNGGIVLGEPQPLPSNIDLNGLSGHLRIDGEKRHAGKTDNPLGALAWVANLAADRGRPMTAGMIVITGSVIPTLPIKLNQTFNFEIENLGAVRMTAV